MNVKIEESAKKFMNYLFLGLKIYSEPLIFLTIQLITINDQILVSTFCARFFKRSQLDTNQLLG